MEMDSGAFERLLVENSIIQLSKSTYQIVGKSGSFDNVLVFMNFKALLNFMIQQNQIPKTIVTLP